ncbi:MAG TPA: hypothetical protein VFQ38_03345 [Longimicrobiales bacterium]|nr:hypothetical protein [Longimicrobiales bacterium]
MRTHFVTAMALALVMALGACKKEGGDANVSADTTTMTGQDTMSGQVVPTTDTIVKTTTTDTIQGAPKDTVKQDTTKR